MFPVSQGSADTLVKRRGKLYHLSIAYFCETFLPKIIKIQLCILELLLKCRRFLFMRQCSLLAFLVSTFQLSVPCGRSSCQYFPIDPREQVLKFGHEFAAVLPVKRSSAKSLVYNGSKRDDLRPTQLHFSAIATIHILHGMTNKLQVGVFGTHCTLCSRKRPPFLFFE